MEIQCSPCAPENVPENTAALFPNMQGTDSICKLDRLFNMQTKLNNNVFKLKDIRDHDGNTLTMSAILNDALAAGSAITARNLSMQWQRNYLEAMIDESNEVKAELLKKWWSDKAANLDHIQEEIVDQLHFWISLALSAGMNANAVFNKYVEKNKVNFARMDSGYAG